MIKIGDKVRSKNPTGQVKIAGTVVGLVKADFYTDKILNHQIDPDVIWGKANPNWKKELVAFIFFDSPQRTATKEEWVESGVKQGFRKEDCERSYDKQCPITQSMVLPIGDLETVK